MTLGILCPGQSAQSRQMLDMLKGEAEALAVFEAFGRVMGMSIEAVLAGEEDLAVNAIAQPLICAIEMASFRCIAERVPEAQIFAGYSVGELAAYGCSGVIGTEDTIRLARMRAEYMDAASKSLAAMIAVRGLQENDLLALCEGREAYVAIRNGPDRFVVGGNAGDVEAVQNDLVARHCHVTQLRVNVASHTPLMADAVSNFRRALEAISFADVKSRIVAGVDGSFVSGRRDAIDKLTSQLVTTIDWAKCMLSLREGGCSVSLELLPGADLTAMVQSQEPSLKARSLSQFRSLPGAAAWACRILDG